MNLACWVGGYCCFELLGVAEALGPGISTLGFLSGNLVSGWLIFRGSCWFCSVRFALLDAGEVVFCAFCCVILASSALISSFILFKLFWSLATSDCTILYSFSAASRLPFCSSA